MSQIEISTSLAIYKSNSQNARVLTENFVAHHGFCPSCGSSLLQTPNNSQAKDFTCSKCDEEFELKAKSSKIGKKIVNGAYDSLFNRVIGQNNLNLYALHYNKREMVVENLLIVPRYFFVTDLIEKRPPLSANARRAGWVGCNILISKVPEIGKIFYIKDRKIINPNNILQEWKKTSFLQEAKSLESRGWLLDTLNCVERIGQDEFNLDQIYAFEAELKQKHPENNHIKDKLRQQLQFLRDKGLIEFIGRGQYRKIPNG